MPSESQEKEPVPYIVLAMQLDAAKRLLADTLAAVDNDDHIHDRTVVPLIERIESFLGLEPGYCTRNSFR